jgi:hypothetical protein
MTDRLGFKTGRQRLPGAHYRTTPCTEACTQEKGERRRKKEERKKRRRIEKKEKMPL